LRHILRAVWSIDCVNHYFVTRTNTLLILLGFEPNSSNFVLQQLIRSPTTWLVKGVLVQWVHWQRSIGTVSPFNMTKTSEYCMLLSKTTPPFQKLINCKQVHSSLWYSKQITETWQWMNFVTEYFLFQYDDNKYLCYDKFMYTRFIQWHRLGPRVL